MDFRKTTVLPADAGKAAQLFHSRVFDFPQANFVVLGAGDDAAALASRAGSFAGDDSDLRWVIWARDRGAIAGEIAKLDDPNGFTATILGAGVKAFTLNVQDKICAIIGMNEPDDNVHVVTAFMEAET